MTEARFALLNLGTQEILIVLNNGYDNFIILLLQQLIYNTLY